MRIGLKDLFAAPVTTATTGVEVYSVPFRLAKAIQADIAPASAEATLYADDAIDAIVKEFSGGTLTLGVNDLLPGKQALLLGQTQDDDGVVYASGNDEAPYFAIGFRARRADGKYRHIWLYKVKFAIPNENHATKGSTITFQTPQLVGSFIKRADDKWKADWTGELSDPVAETWFDVVREPRSDSPGDTTPGGIYTNGQSMAAGLLINGATQPLNMRIGG